MNINLLLKATENWEQQPTFELGRDGINLDGQIWTSSRPDGRDRISDRERIIENEEQSIRSVKAGLSLRKEIDYSQDNIQKGWQILLNGYLNNTIIETLKEVQISAEEFYQTQYQFI